MPTCASFKCRLSHTDCDDCRVTLLSRKALQRYQAAPEYQCLQTIKALGQMMDTFHTADALAAVRQRAEEDTQLLSFMESNVATLHARLKDYMRARH